MPGSLERGLLVRRDAIPVAEPEPQPCPRGDGDSPLDPTPPDPGGGGDVPAPDPRSRRFFAGLELDPERAGLEVARIMDGLLVELTRVPGSRLRLNLEIEGAAADSGYSEDVVDTVKANARDLRLDENSLGFEEN